MSAHKQPVEVQTIRQYCKTLRMPTEPVFFLGDAAQARPSGHLLVCGCLPAAPPGCVHDGVTAVNELVEAKEEQQLSRAMAIIISSAHSGTAGPK